MTDHPIIKSVELYPVATSRLYGEPSQHVLVRIEANKVKWYLGEKEPVIPVDTKKLGRAA